jgi:hypothetical protein
VKIEWERVLVLLIITLGMLAALWMVVVQENAKAGFCGNPFSVERCK